MPRLRFSDVEEYLAQFAPDVRARLESVRQAIKEAAPDAQETISYGMPAFRLHGTYLVYFAGFRKHISVYPAPRGALEFAQELSAYKGGKGTVQFPLDKPLPLGLVARVTRHLAEESARMAAARRRTAS